MQNSLLDYASVAQLAVQLICNQQVVGSSPTGSFISTVDVPLLRIMAPESWLNCE